MRGLFKDPFSPFWYDRSSPMADGIAILWHAAANIELVSGVAGVLSGTTPPVLDVGDPGRILKLTGSTSSATQSYISFGSQPQHADITKSGNRPCTFFAYLAPTNDGPIIAHNDGNTVNAGWSFGSQVNGSQAAVIIESSGGNSNNSSAGFTAAPRYCSNFYSLMCCIDGLNTTTSGTWYLNGRKISNTSTAFTGTPGSDAAQTLYIGGHDTGLSGARSIGGGIEMVAVWRRMLSPGEAMSMARDRYQLFRRQGRLRMTVPGVSAPAASARPVVMVCT